MAVRETKIVIKARDAASRAFKRVQNAAERLRKKLGDQLKVSLKGLEKAFQSVVRVGGAVVGVIGGVSAGLAKFAERGARVISVTNAFNANTENSIKALRMLREATENLISDFDLMATFNKAVALQAAESVEQFSRMSKGAIALGRALGLDAKFALESFMLGVGRQSRLILDNLGITISAKDAYQDYAQAVGKSTKALNDQEKRAAFRQAAIDALEEKTRKLSEGTIEGVRAWSRLTTVFENVRDRMAKMVAVSPVLARFFDTLTEKARTLGAVLEEVFDPGAVKRTVEEIGKMPAEMAKVREELANLEAMGLERERRQLLGELPEDLRTKEARESLRGIETPLGFIGSSAERNLVLSKQQVETIVRLRDVEEQLLNVEEQREAARQRQLELLNEEKETREEITDEVKELAQAEEDVTNFIEARGETIRPGERTRDEGPFVRAARGEFAFGTGEVTGEGASPLGRTEAARKAAEKAAEEAAKQSQRVAEEWAAGIEGALIATVDGANLLESAMSGLMNIIIRKVEQAISQLSGGGIFGGLLGGFAGGLIGLIGQQLFASGGRDTGPVPVEVVNRVKIDRGDEPEPVIVVQMRSPFDDSILEQFIVQSERMRSRGGTVRVPRPAAREITS